MNVVSFNKNNKSEDKNNRIAREVWSLINTGEVGLQIYTCLGMGNIKYRLRKSKDDTLVAEFDRELNMIGGLKTLVDIEDLNRVMPKLEYQKSCIDRAGEALGRGKSR